MMQLNFGGADGRGGKMSRFELGPVYCGGSGADQDAAAGWREGPRSCKDLWRRGVTQVGGRRKARAFTMDSASQKNVVKGCVITTATRATFDHVFWPAECRYV